MKKIGFILFLAIMLVGCGTGSSGANEEQNQDGKTNADEKGIVEGEIVPSLTQESTFSYTYQVVNQTEKEVTLEFTSSQRIDYSVKTKAGEEVFLYSSVASFLQALGEEKIKPGDALVYDIDLSDINLSAGEYVLTAWMTPTEGEKFTVTQDFTVE
ncbi:BsuPI-related putative proteinase inhibitor [Aquibacillus rhizosphaerae]|uniref:Intracellular proteinase inhibitor BsuPI domain-containing protein n=1 Tax=Aquibacillus rhizosphaerae TaxID=3051431 RepID=A0ABT7L1L6_9BACI|nr:BsuPI-related putative proteinase inhibitor [Aquibacillus sp. LR5S19]MDL4839738.1 BsuPI-related putative proteinase inhibitor [Aquibacillus sp. LR5S19]